MGKVIMSGIVPPLVKPYGGPTLGDIAVGSAIQLSENGELVDYLVVHQGLPSSIYDESCNGTWLMRKTLSYVSGWISDNSYYTYEQDETIIKPYMENLISIFTPGTQEIIKQVKIPYVKGNGASSFRTVMNGADGLSCKLFLPSAPEVGFVYDSSDLDYKYVDSDGAKFEYFESGISESALNKRIAYADKTTEYLTAGSTGYWWTRSNPNYPFRVMNDGSGFCRGSTKYKYGIRTTMILPSFIKLQQLNEMQ